MIGFLLDPLILVEIILSSLETLPKTSLQNTGNSNTFIYFNGKKDGFESVLEPELVLLSIVLLLLLLLLLLCQLS